MKFIRCLLLLTTLPFGNAHADASASKNAKVTLVYQLELPNVPSKSIKAVLAEYGPVTGYKAGQSFSEMPGDRHSVSANVGKTQPARLLTVFVVDTNETELSIPIGN